jgi:hypothetical protein
VVSAEPDLYGFSDWLASYLNCPRQQSIRGYQHGWIWWDREPGSFQGLDPNFNKAAGALVQNEQIAKSLMDEGIYAKAVGLPFLTYKNYSGRQVPERRPETLFVPTHSNPWNDVSGDVVDSCNQHRDKGWSVMLSATDYRVGAPGFKNIEQGAGVFVKDSFRRLFQIFHSYEYMVTDAMGSHVGYGLACGMKVRIDVDNYRKHQNAFMQTTDYKRSLTFTGKDILDLDFVESRFPGITTDWHSGDIDVANEPPEVIATELGWKFN